MTFATLREALDWPRFWSKVDCSGECWTWTASRWPRGYGKYGVGRAVLGAHRVAWTLIHGPIPVDMEVCHRCDNPPCVRPTHLFLASHTENMRDMWRKGRGVTNRRRFIGTDNPTSKLSDASVREIKARLADGESQSALGRRFGVARETIRDIQRGRIWRHIA